MLDFHNFRQQMQAWYAECVAYDALQQDRLDRWRNLEPESAQFLMQMVYMQQAQKVLEIGTSNGVSTAWLAYVLTQLSGQLTTLEIDPDRSRLAQQKLDQLQLHDVHFVVADAANFLAQTQEQYDLIFLDAERRYYSHYTIDLKRLLSGQRGRSLVVDNVRSHAHEVQDFLLEFERDTDYLCSTLDVGAGLFVATWQG